MCTNQVSLMFKDKILVSVREVNVAARLLHDFLDVVASFADDVAVICKTDVHFQSRSLRFCVQFGDDFLFRPLNEVAFS